MLSAMARYNCIPELHPISTKKPEIECRAGRFEEFRKFLGTHLEDLWELSASIRRLHVEGLIAQGSEKHSDHSLRSLYIGHYDNFAFIHNLLYKEFSVMGTHSRIPVTAVRRVVKQHCNSVDVVILDLELLFCRLLGTNDFLTIPQWIRQKFTIPNTWGEVLDKFRRNTKKTDLRKVRKYGFSYRISRKEEDFHAFYDELYVPYLKKRFGDEVIIEPKWKVMRQCRKGELMHIIRSDEVVCAALLHKSGDRLAYVWVGVPNHIGGDMFQGAFSALYYFTILYGYNNGCREVDFLGSRPLLNDGLFLYKRKWGTFVERSPIPRGDILIKPVRLTDGVKSFFAHNYFVFREGDALCAGVFYVEEQLKIDVVAEFVSRYGTPGIEEIRMYCFKGFAREAVSWADAQKPRVRLIDVSRIESDGSRIFDLGRRHRTSEVTNRIAR
jgi:hypothetical protein